MQHELSLDFPKGILSKVQTYKSADLRVKEPSKSTRKIFKSLKKGVKNKENSSKLQLLIATPVINNTI